MVRSASSTLAMQQLRPIALEAVDRAEAFFLTIFEFICGLGRKAWSRGIREADVPAVVKRASEDEYSYYTKELANGIARGVALAIVLTLAAYVIYRLYRWRRARTHGDADIVADTTNSQQLAVVQAAPVREQVRLVMPEESMTTLEDLRPWCRCSQEYELVVVVLVSAVIEVQRGSQIHLCIAIIREVVALRAQLRSTRATIAVLQEENDHDRACAAKRAEWLRAAAAVLVQRIYRGLVARGRLKVAKHLQTASATKIQTTYRARVASTKYRVVVGAVIAVQLAWRRCSERSRRSSANKKKETSDGSEISGTLKAGFDAGTESIQMLDGVEGSFECRTPALLGIQRCSRGVEVAVNADGNCFGVSWLVPVVASAARCPADLDHLLKQIRAGAARGAFRVIDRTRKHYVGYLMQYLEDLRGRWSKMQRAEGGGREFLDRQIFGSELAVEVIEMFLGPNRAAGRNAEDTAAEPKWLKLKRAAVLVTRALDLFTAPESITAADRAMFGTVCSSVEIDFGLQMAMLQSTGDTLAAEGQEDMMRPGGSVRVELGFEVEFYSTAGGGHKNVEDYSSLFSSLNGRGQYPVARGFKVVKRVHPHFDFAIDEGGPLGAAVRSKFSKALDRDKLEIDVLRAQMESRAVTSPERLDEILFGENNELQDMEAQIAAFKEFEAQRSRQMATGARAASGAGEGRGGGGGGGWGGWVGSWIPGARGQDERKRNGC